MRSRDEKQERQSTGRNRKTLSKNFEDPARLAPGLYFLPTERDTASTETPITVDLKNQAEIHLPTALEVALQRLTRS
jgi:hypothetical protein